MSAPRHEFVPACGHELHVTLWGDPLAKPLVMWHGLARTGRDFDELAAALSDRHFVICPDTFGRGLSSWAASPTTAYSIVHMADTAEALLDHLGIARAGWLGTSMGGLIGMHLASDNRAGRLNYLVINDIGPEVPQDAIDRILAYAADLPRFATLSEAESWLRAVYAPFGEVPDGFWRRMTMTSVRRREDGQFTLHYDPQIVRQFDFFANELTSWDRYSRITLPTHVLAGAQSDILTAPILARMGVEGPRPAVTIFENCGHAPALANADDIQLLRSIIAGLESHAGMSGQPRQNGSA